MINIATWEIATNDDPFMGLSLTIYCAGCDRNCKGCHNPDLQDFSNGTPMTVDQIVELVNSRRSLIDSVVFLGGDWIYYPKELEEVSKQIKQAIPYGLKLILYTGELFENISDDLLDNLDIVIDGPYIESKRTTDAIPASSNQRVFINPYKYTFYEVKPSTLPINKEHH